MKTLTALLLLFTVGLLAGCAVGPTMTTQQTQAQFTQACGLYSVDFAVALKARQAGLLNPTWIQTVSSLDSSITPLCTGPLPSNPALALSQVQAAITTLSPLLASQAVQGLTTTKGTK